MTKEIFFKERPSLIQCLLSFSLASNDIRPSEKRRESVCLYSTTGCLRRGKQNRIYFTLDVREGKGRNVFELTEQRKTMYFISIQARKSLGKEIEIEKKSFKPR